MHTSVDNYVNDLKKKILPLNSWPSKFQNLAELSNIVISRDTGLNKSIFFSYNTSTSWKNFNSKFPICTIEEYTKLVDLFLELVGIKDILKDYILISSFSQNKGGLNNSSFSENHFCYFIFELLFVDNESLLTKFGEYGFNYFNSSLFKKAENMNDKDIYYKVRFEEFTECFFDTFFYHFEQNSNLKFSECLNKEYIKKVEGETLTNLYDFYQRKKELLFNGSYSYHMVFGKKYVNLFDFSDGSYQKFSGSYYFNNKKTFFKNQYLWFDFILFWQISLFQSNSLINSELNLSYVGTFQYLINSLE